jgi:hypothetical protein
LQTKNKIIFKYFLTIKKRRTKSQQRTNKVEQRKKRIAPGSKPEKRQKEGKKKAKKVKSKKRNAPRSSDQKMQKERTKTAKKFSKVEQELH